jgi:hypothetical protein
MRLKENSRSSKPIIQLSNVSNEPDPIFLDSNYHEAALICKCIPPHQFQQTGWHYKPCSHMLEQKEMINPGQDNTRRSMITGTRIKSKCSPWLKTG